MRLFCLALFAIACASDPSSSHMHEPQALEEASQEEISPVDAMPEFTASMEALNACGEWEESYNCLYLILDAAQDRLDDAAIEAGAHPLTVLGQRFDVGEIAANLWAPLEAEGTETGQEPSSTAEWQHLGESDVLYKLFKEREGASRGWISQDSLLETAVQADRMRFEF